MQKLMCAGFLAIFVVVAVYAGGEPWKSKPYTQWDQKDVTAVLESSPWAKTNVAVSGTAVNTPLTAGADNTPPAGATGVSSTHVNPASASAPPQLQGGAPEASGGSSQRYSLFWASSRTIREASARRAVLNGAATPEAAAKLAEATPDSYQILINSGDLAVLEKRGVTALRDAAFIQLKKEKKKISPSSVVFQKSSGKVVGVIFSFPKADASGGTSIPVEEKEVEFSVQVGDGQLRAAFNLKQMNDMQGQDL